MPLARRILDRLRADPARVVSHLVAENGTAAAVTSLALLARAWGFARALRTPGPSGPEAVAGICLFPGLDLHAAWLGALWAGYIPSMVPPPSPRMEPAKYATGFQAMATHVRAEAWVVSREAAALLGTWTPAPGSRLLVADEVQDWHGEAPPCAVVERELDQVTLVQHSSGTTGLQKAIALTGRQVLAHHEAYQTALGMSPRDVVVSWLPLYHDMGFVACFLMPLLGGMHLVEMSPFDWARRPLRLLELIGTYRGTLCWMPNFAFAYLAASRERAGESARFDLSSVRAWVNSSEPVMASSCERFVAACGADGVRWDQMTASYAMAENVYAVTQSGPGTLRRLGVDREAFVTGHRLLPATGASAMTLVGSGSVLPGTELRIVDGAGTVCADGAVGEIHLRGTCRFQGYLRRPDLSAAAIDAEGWYRTGDLGAMVEGELFVTGRLKDLVIIQGRNFYPGDVELEVGEVPGVAAGRVAAFGVPDERDGTERLVVVAERDADSTEPDAAVALRVRAHVAQMFNCTAGDVRMVPPRWLVKSTSGKVARADTRAKYLRDVH